MQFIVFIPALLLFLYALYRFSKDDYIFIRKGITVEQTFDIAFTVLWISLFFSRLFYLLIHIPRDYHIIIDFFSFTNNGFSLTGALVGGICAVFLIGKHKRLPLGRLSDFLSLSFLYTLPVMFLASAALSTKKMILFSFLNAVVYFLLLLFFVQFLYPKTMSRTLKEGALAILFIICFSFIALLTSLLSSLSHIQNFINPENSILLLLIIFSATFFLRQGRSPHTRRTVSR